MIYTSGTNRILSLDEANSTDPVGWAVNTDYGHVLFNDNRTKAGWSGNTSKFSYGSGLTLNSSYCTMPVIGQSGSDRITCMIFYEGYTDHLIVYGSGYMPWFITSAYYNSNRTFNFKSWQNYNYNSVIHNDERLFDWVPNSRIRTNWDIGSLNFGTTYINGSWKFSLRPQNAVETYFDPPQIYYLRNGYIVNVWNPLSQPDNNYVLSPNCVRPISFTETPSVNERTYSDVTNAVVKTSLYCMVNCCTTGVTYTMFNFYVGDLYAEYPSGNTYFIGNGRRESLTSQCYNISSYVIMFYALAPGTVTTPYSGKVSSSGTLSLSGVGGYRGTAPISATASGSNVITQTN